MRELALVALGARALFEELANHRFRIDAERHCRLLGDDGLEKLTEFAIGGLFGLLVLLLDLGRARTLLFEFRSRRLVQILNVLLHLLALVLVLHAERLFLDDLFDRILLGHCVGGGV